jgi:serine/threonine protein kinase
MSSLVGSNIGGVYNVLERIGSGGMGTVYRGVHTRPGRTVAIKVLHSGAPGQLQEDRLLSEARLQAQLRHPGIVALYDFVEFNGQGCIIMEFVEGPTLAERLQSREPLPVHSALALLRQISEAVAYLHGRIIIHGDLKPANIKLCPDGTIKLLDFGIARTLRASTGATTRVITGTFEYMAPECLARKSADRRSDIWSLGILLYEMLTRRLPFTGDTIGELSRQMKTGYTPASSLNKQVEANLDEFIARCLKQNPGERFTSVDALRRDLDRPRAFKPALGKRPLAALSAAAIALLAIALGWSTLHSRSVPANQAQVSETKAIDVDVVNSSAEVYGGDHDLGRTPVRINEQMGHHVSLMLKRPGFTDLPVDFDVDERSSYSYVLREAPSQD